MKGRFVFLLLACAPALAMAQLSYSIGAVSDYRYRGVSLSDESPSVQGSANFDHASGAYAGLSLARARLAYTNANAQGIAYAGMARRIGQVWSVDVGATATVFYGARKYDYGEWYAGLARERFGVRLSVAPRYFGVGGRSLYGEMNASVALAPGLDLTCHAGYLRPQASRWLYVPASRADFKLGLNKDFGSWTGQLAWTATREGAALYRAGRSGHARRLVAGATRAF
jgi:uncharacterized protein (TIGR02001 family)